MSYYNYDAEKFRGYCVLCGSGFAKRDIDRIYISNGRYGPHKILAYVCRECVPKVADFLGVELPDIDGEPQRRKLYDHAQCPQCMTDVRKADRYCWFCGKRLREV